MAIPAIQFYSLCLQTRPGCLLASTDKSTYPVLHWHLGPLGVLVQVALGLHPLISGLHSTKRNTLHWSGESAQSCD